MTGAIGSGVAARCSPTRSGSPAVSTAAARAGSTAATRTASAGTDRAGAEKSVTAPLSLTARPAVDGPRPQARAAPWTGARLPPTAPCPQARPVGRALRAEQPRPGRHHADRRPPARGPDRRSGLALARRAAHRRGSGAAAGPPAQGHRHPGRSGAVPSAHLRSRAPGARGQPGRRRRRERPHPPAVGERPPHGRRRDDRRLPGGHPLLRRAVRRPARQRGAVPPGDDGALRHRCARHRSRTGPAAARTAVGDGREPSAAPSWRW